MPIDPKIREYFARKFRQEEEPVETGFDGQRFAGGALDALGANARNSMRIYGVNPEGGSSAQDAIVQNRERQRKQATGAESRKMSAAKSIYEIDQNADQQAYDRDMDAKKLEAERAKVLAYLEAKKAKENAPKPPSLGQAKQQGLVESGRMANQQYEDAVKAGEENKTNDPTSAWEFIDNTSWMPNVVKSNDAVARQSAESAWVESYLRDASGAAIATSERAKYADDFFPRPGDSPTVVANKAALREQKMRNAQFAAGAQPDALPGQPTTDDLDQMSDAQLEAEARRLGIK